MLVTEELGANSMAYFLPAEPEWQQIDWSYVPYIDELHPIALENMQFAVYQYAPKRSDDFLDHETSSIDEVLDLYRDSGFDTDVILQNPFTHNGPAAACPIGFAMNLPIDLQFAEFRRFRRWICRIHVDIRRSREEGVLSLPHVEVDPAYDWYEHLRLQGEEVYGQPAVRLLQSMLRR